MAFLSLIVNKSARFKSSFRSVHHRICRRTWSTICNIFRFAAWRHGISHVCQGVANSCTSDLIDMNQTFQGQRCRRLRPFELGYARLEQAKVSSVQCLKFDHPRLFVSGQKCDASPRDKSASKQHCLSDAVLLSLIASIVRGLNPSYRKKCAPASRVVEDR